MNGHRALRPAVAAVLCLGVSCSTQGLAFREDTRVQVVEPGDRSTVTLPVTVAWSAEEVDGPYAVFVDRSPMPPGKTVAWLFRDDKSCVVSQGCPDEAYLSDHGVFVTDERQVVLERLPRFGDGDRREWHEATVVLLDDDGTRLGESAFAVAFDVDREDR